MENAVLVGDHIQSRFKAAQKDLWIIGEVRGKGLMIGLELVNRQGQQITVEQVKQIIKNLGKAGVVMTKCGQSALRIAPALSITRDIAYEVIDIIVKVLKDFEREL